MKAISEYQRDFRRGDFEPLAVSGLYDLFPSQPAGPEPAESDFRQSWPSADRAGVYLVFDQDLSLLYVGKASVESSLGKRLYTYFRPAKDGTCTVYHRDWLRTPRYVITVAVPEPTRFEACALEEYLIEMLQPINNTVGKRLDRRQQFTAKA